MRRHSALSLFIELEIIRNSLSSKWHILYLLRLASGSTMAPPIAAAVRKNFWSSTIEAPSSMKSFISYCLSDVWDTFACYGTPYLKTFKAERGRFYSPITSMDLKSLFLIGLLLIVTSHLLFKWCSSVLSVCSFSDARFINGCILIIILLLL